MVPSRAASSTTSGPPESYAAEELVPDLGAAFLAADFGIATDPVVENSAAYIASWLKALRDDKRMIVTAAAQAEKAARWIRGDRWRG